MIDLVVDTGSLVARAPWEPQSRAAHPTNYATAWAVRLALLASLASQAPAPL